MRNLKFIHIMVLNIAAIVATSCGDMLDLAPIDNYGSTSYWKTESQVSAYIDGLHKHGGTAYYHFWRIKGRTL